MEHSARQRRANRTTPFNHRVDNAARCEIAGGGDGAIMTLTQEGLPPAPIAATRDGWAAMFDALARQLAQGQ
jgi:hypothetical protein